VTACGADEHPGADQLIADVGGWAGIPGAGGDASGLGKYVVTAIGDLAQLLDRFVKIAALGGVPHRGAVKGAVEKLIRVDMPRAIEWVFDGLGRRVTQPIATLNQLPVDRRLPRSRPEGDGDSQARWQSSQSVTKCRQGVNLSTPCVHLQGEMSGHGC
jgi:hypothetical protein